MNLRALPAYLKNFLKESRQELRHVNWPTRKEAVYLTTVVVILSLILAVFLGFFDFLFLSALRRLLGL
ncbi:MAG: preprotein translocase subunit SecE [Patescibacteria group bacterium]